MQYGGMIDFLIIGGGIAGASAAARLAPFGSVTLLEAEDAPGYHASGRSAAMFEENYGSPSTVALNQASRAYHQEAGVLSPRGFLLVGTADAGAEVAATKSELLMDDITVAEARDMVPILGDDITFAAYHQDALDIDTDRLLQGYLRDARAQGALVHTKAKVVQITRVPHGWQVHTEGQVFDAQMIVNAAGAWVDQIAAMAGVAPIGVTPLRRSMARIPAPGGHDVSGWPMLFGPGESWYAKPDAGKLLVSPAEEDPVAPQDAWADDMVLAEGIARYQAHVSEPVTRVEHSWAGLRTFAPDRALVIGFGTAEPQFFWLAGQGGYGMQSSPAASQLAADLIIGATPSLDPQIVAALSPNRFASS